MTQAMTWRLGQLGFVIKLNGLAEETDQIPRIIHVKSVDVLLDLLVDLDVEPEPDSLRV